MINKKPKKKTGYCDNVNLNGRRLQTLLSKYKTSLDHYLFSVPRIRVPGGGVEVFDVKGFIFEFIQL